MSISPMEFQRTLDQILNNLRYNICAIYIDDLVVPGANIKQHNERLINYSF